MALGNLAVVSISTKNLKEVLQLIITILKQPTLQTILHGLLHNKLLLLNKLLLHSQSLSKDWQNQVKNGMFLLLNLNKPNKHNRSKFNRLLNKNQILLIYGIQNHNNSR